MYKSNTNDARCYITALNAGLFHKKFTTNVSAV